MTSGIIYLRQVIHRHIFEYSVVNDDDKIRASLSNKYMTIAGLWSMITLIIL